MRKQSAIVGASIFQVAAGAGLVNAESRPNIVFILADDMGWSDPGFLGGDIDTPNINRLAQQGTLFTRFYNHAKCTPSRSSLLTGVHFHRQTAGHVVDQFCGVTTIAKELKSAGYYTVCSGKWHVPDQPTDWGFDRYFGLLQGAANHFDPCGTLQLDPRCYMRQEYALNGEPVVPDGNTFYSTDAYTQYALDFLNERPANQPFFLYLAYTAPHWPLQAPEELIQKYADKYTNGWDRLRSNRYEQLLKCGIFSSEWKLSPRDPDVVDWEKWPQKDDAARCMAVHAAMVDRMDQQIGRVLDYLEQIGELDNTLICFTSDNGVSAELLYDRTPERPAGTADSFRLLPLGFCNAVTTPFIKYKTWNSNGGVCSPLVVCWPGRVAAGRIDDIPLNILDFFPTFLAVAGAEYPQGLRPLDGQNILPGLTGQGARSAPKPMFFQMKYGRHVDQKAVLDWPWKAWFDSTNGWKLFRLDQDPTEVNDLATAHPEVLKKLLDRYQKFDAAAILDQETYYTNNAQKQQAE